MTTEDAVTAAAVDSLRGTGGPRLRDPLAALIRHRRVVPRETRPSRRERAAAVALRTRTGQTRTDTRQEFVLLSGGSVGAPLKGTGRHACRPGGARPDSGAVFAVRASLVKESPVKDFTPTDDPAPAGEHGVPEPFPHARFDLVLERS
ncbi:dioxygenase [Streptomyces shenzhenensis]|uniref:dioxygenase n=1 Tax=Streptomyces shenzhenensis TaxID=943815 RepID=UPI001F1BEDE9|nr:dioxygenase [Streptomyces shenzhenensis]